MAKKTEPKDDGYALVDVDMADEGDRYPAKITAIAKPVPARDIFKDKAKDPERPTLVLSFEGPGGVSGTCPLSAPGISPEGKVVVRNPKSNLYRFIKRYKTLKVGTPIEVRVDENGFYRIAFE